MRPSKYHFLVLRFQASTLSVHQVTARPVRVVPQMSTLMESIWSPVMLYTQNQQSNPFNQVSNTSMLSSPEYFSGGDTLIFLILGRASHSWPTQSWIRLSYWSSWVSSSWDHSLYERVWEGIDLSLVLLRIRVEREWCWDNLWSSWLLCLLLCLPLSLNELDKSEGLLWPRSWAHCPWWCLLLSDRV